VVGTDLFDDFLWLYLVSFQRHPMSKNIVTLKSASKVIESGTIR